MTRNERKRQQLQAIRDPEARRQFIEREKREIAVAARKQEDKATLKSILRHAERLVDKIKEYVDG